MADRSTILSADAEEKLLQPIEEYVGKIQAQNNGRIILHYCQ